MLTYAVHSAEWYDMMSRWGMKAEWLAYYGCHFEFEKLYNAKQYTAMMDELDEADENKRAFLLHHVACCGGTWSVCTRHPPFRKAYELHCSKYPLPNK